jgi:hypothetical protein
MRQYNPLQVVGSWTTPIGVFDILQGVINGEFLTSSRDNKFFTRENDLAGNATRIVQPNQGGQLTVNISASDPVNAQLSGAHAADRLATNVIGLLLLKDLNGLTVVKNADAFLEDFPDPRFGNARGSWAWTWQIGKMTPFIAGHDTIGA